MDRKLQIFKDLFNEFDSAGYNRLINNVHVLNSLLYEGDYSDKLVVVHTSNMDTGSFLESLDYDFRDAYEKVFGRMLSSYPTFIEAEKLSKYESIDDYFRVKDMERANSQARHNEKISIFKERFERASVNPENIYAIIEKQQKEIDRLTKKLNASKKKKWLFK